MDKEQWLDCQLWLMLTYVNLKASDRKKRLLAVAFCHHISHLYNETRCRTLLKWARKLSAFGNDPVPKRLNCLIQAVDQAALCADGLIPAGNLEAASEMADRLSFVEEYHYACYDESWGPRDFKLFASSVAAAAIHYATAANVDVEMVHKLAARAALRFAGSDANEEDPAEVTAQSALVRDLFPNPDCIYPWQSKSPPPKVVELAESIYEQAAFHELPRLGQLLRKAGCQDEAVLAHCKSPGPHVRGCWVIDAILGKE